MHFFSVKCPNPNSIDHVNFIIDHVNFIIGYINFIIDHVEFEIDHVEFEINHPMCEIDPATLILTLTILRNAFCKNDTYKSIRCV